jgi:radical SAM protein with 4Fe4S-binding SPASM domain
MSNAEGSPVDTQDGVGCAFANEVAAIKEDAVYVLNPTCRLRNGKDHVLLYGARNGATYHLHRRAGVVAALCNGENTVMDIAQTVSPLVRGAENDDRALAVAKAHVCGIIASLLRTEREGDERKGELPARGPLIGKADLEAFGRITRGTYTAREFLPRDESEICERPQYPIHEPSPIGLNWHVTSECSTDCRYCYLQRRKVRPMPRERALSLIREAHDIGVLIITTTGGDPLLYPYLSEFLGELSRYKFVADTMSTKSFLSKERARELSAADDVLWSLQFSIDSTVPEIADYLTRTEGYCERIMASIANALDAGLRVSVKAVITPYNVLTIPKLYRDIKARGVEVIRLASYARSGFHHTDDLFNHTESYEWLHREILRLKEEYPDDDLHIQNGEPVLAPMPPGAKDRKWKERSRCSAGRTSMMICSDGKVIPCEQMPETEEFVCGDVSVQSIQEVWDGKTLKELTYGLPREKFQGQVCYDCAEREVCHERMGYCIRDVVLYRGTMYNPPDSCPRADLPFIRTL